MRITLGLFGFEVFSLAINDHAEAALIAALAAADDGTADEEADEDAEEPPALETVNAYGSVESTVVLGDGAARWDDPGWRYNLSSPWEPEDLTRVTRALRARPIGFTRRA